MIERAAWEDLNSQYLSLRLHWLRLRLEQEARRHSQDPEPGESATFDEELEQLRQKRLLLETDAESPLPLPFLRSRLGLSSFEEDVLFFCAAPEFDPVIPALCARSLGSSQQYPTFAHALSLFKDASWDLMSPERPLRYWKLIEIHQHGSEPLTSSALRADERIVNFIKGLNYLDDRLATCTTLAAAPSDSPPPASQQRAVDEILRAWSRPDWDSTPVIQLLGPDRGSKHLVASSAAAAIGRGLYRMHAEFLPTQPGEIEALARLWQRESMLLPIALIVDEQESGPLNETQHSMVRRVLAKCRGPVFLATRDLWQLAPRETIALDIAKPTAVEQRCVWAAALGEGSGDIGTLLASQFSLNAHEIQTSAHNALSDPGDTPQEFHGRLWKACRASSRPKLDALARRIDAKATWEHIVLPEEQTKLLRQIAAQVEHRGRVYGEWGFGERTNRGLGISALFAGDSGTGKTMAAEVIAGTLDLNLYRIDLSAVVSKYIGETEKNLCRIFDAADDGGVILFFDEADALFGKRSEVKDSHDRYANIEINYLLQRIEAYRGLAILATNMKSALDNAFMRRLRFIVNFPFPSAADRRRIWQTVFPSATPTSELDYERLGRLNLTGGSIYNIALNSAFLAAQGGTDITMSCILDAARSEFLKLDRPFSENDFLVFERTGARL